MSRHAVQICGKRSTIEMIYEFYRSYPGDRIDPPEPASVELRSVLYRSSPAGRWTPVGRHIEAFATRKFEAMENDLVAEHEYA